jgi:hypothetical protein
MCFYGRRRGIGENRVEEWWKTELPHYRLWKKGSRRRLCSHGVPPSYLGEISA